MAVRQESEGRVPGRQTGISHHDETRSERESAKACARGARLCSPVSPQTTLLTDGFLCVGAFNETGSLSLAEIPVATNDTAIKRVAAANIVKPVDGPTMVLLVAAIHDAWSTAISALRFDRSCKVRDCKRQHEAE